MSTTSMTLGLIAEIFTIVSFPLGLLLLIVALLIRAIRGDWFETEAEVAGSELRWLGRDGTFYRQELTAGEHATLGHTEQTKGAEQTERAESAEQTELLTVFCRTSSPSRAHLERVAHDEKTLRVLGTVFLGVGVVAVIVSIASAIMG